MWDCSYLIDVNLNQTRRLFVDATFRFVGEIECVRILIKLKALVDLELSTEMVLYPKKCIVKMVVKIG